MKLKRIASAFLAGALALSLAACGGRFKKVKPEKVKRLSTVLTQNMGLFFVPAGVGLMNSFGIISEYWAVLLIASVVSTILVIASVALVQQKLEKGK